MEIALALGMVALAVTLLSIDRIPIEVSSLTIVVLLALTGLVTPEEALAGFSSETAIFIFALLAMTQGLASTGVMQIVGRRLLARTRVSPRSFVLILLFLVAGFSSIASNTAVTAAFVPVVTASAAQLGASPRTMLMPMAFASMLGGTIFLFGTSTNLVISGAMGNFGLERIGFAELTPLGLPLTIAGVLVTYVIGRRLLSRGAPPDEPTPAQREYVTELVIPAGSRLIGRPLRELSQQIGLSISALVRDGATHAAEPDLVLRDGDEMVISGTLDDMLRIKDLRSVAILADLRMLDDARGPAMLVELAVPPTSTLEGRSLSQVRFADRYGVVAIAIHRHPTLQRERRELDLLDSLTAGEELKHLRLSVGDMLLVRGPEHRIRELQTDEDVTVLSGFDYQRPRYDRAVLAVVIFAATVIVAGLRWISPAIAGLGGVLLMIASRCVASRTALRVDWRVVIMIGALLTLGLAMERSGAGELIARSLMLPLAHALGPHGTLLLQMVLTIVLSVPMSNQAAALIMLPIGIHTATSMGLDPRTFAIGTCLAASCSFVTPFEPAAALVYGPGRYRVTDFLRVGTPTTLVTLALLTIGVPLVWPFTR